MKQLREAVKEYLMLRRKLGAKLFGVDNYLRSFAAFAEKEGASFVTIELALRWAQQPPSLQPASYASRLQMVRGFATWRSASDPRTQVPPVGLLIRRYPRKPPYIYRDEEIRAIIRAAWNLPAPKGLTGHTYSTIFGLLSVTGMRLSEVLALDREDVEFQEAVLTIRRTKFDKSRLVPIHSSVRAVLVKYARYRDKIFPQPTTRAFFLSERGRRVTGCATRYNFAKVSREVGLRARSQSRRHGHGPRLHDMRHRFAVQTLLNWYRKGADVEREAPKLATYLGHVHFNETYWYLEAVPELLQLAKRRLVQQGRKEVRP